MKVGLIRACDRVSSPCWHTAHFPCQQVLMEMIQDKKAQPQQSTQNTQIMRAKPREEDHSLNIFLRSGMTMGVDKGKHLKKDGWVHKAVEKEVEFNLHHTKESFLEENKDFTEASTSRSQEKILETNTLQEVDPSILATFLKTCMKLLHDQKVVKGLQGLINKFTNKEKTPTEQCTVRQIGKNKAQMGCEMRPTVQIGEYKMNQVIWDLGSDANVLSKKKWERMGKPTLHWSPIQLSMENQQKIIPMGHFYGVTMDIEGESELANFQVIEIVDDSKQYPALLGIDWAINMNGVINLKKWKISF